MRNPTGKPRVNAPPQTSQGPYSCSELPSNQACQHPSNKLRQYYQTPLLPDPPEAGEAVISGLQAAKSNVCFLFFFKFWMTHPLLQSLELRLKKDGSFGKGLNLYSNTSLVGNHGVFYPGTTYRASFLVVLPQSNSLLQWTTLKIMGCKLPS